MQTYFYTGFSQTVLPVPLGVTKQPDRGTIRSRPYFSEIPLQIIISGYHFHFEYTQNKFIHITDIKVDMVQFHYNGIKNRLCVLQVFFFPCGPDICASLSADA
jgi:hypothetical protein